MARVKWGDIDRNAGLLQIREAKAGNSWDVPLTPEILDAIAIAGKPVDLVFPGCGNIGGGKNRKELAVKGNALRRTWKTFAANECKIEYELSEYLIGHVLPGMSKHYLLRWAMASGKAIRDAQAKISREMMAALHGERRAKRRAA